MQLLQLVAAWLFPHAVCATTTTGPAAAATAAFVAAAFEPDCSSSPESSAGGAGAKAAELGTTSSPSMASSTTSSSSNADQFTSTASRRQGSRSASPSCFGVRGAGRLLRAAGRARGRSPEKQEAAACAAPKRDVVGRYLRKISRRLRRARAAAKDPTPASGVVADDTARWREEAVASVIAYCNETLRRGTSPPPAPPPAPPPPPPSPSLEVWLLEGMSDTAAHPPSPPWPPRRDVSLLERQAQRTARCKISPPPRHDCPLAVSVVAHGEEPPPHHVEGAGYDSGGETAAVAQPARPSPSSSDPSGELDMRDSFEELEYLETFDGDEEMIGRHFITVQL